MTVQRKRFKNYAAAEEAAARCERIALLEHRALQAVLLDQVVWLEQAPFRAGIAWPHYADGGLVILEETTTTHVRFDVWNGDDFVAAHATLSARPEEEMLRRLRQLARDVGRAREQLISDAEQRQKEHCR